MKSLHLFPALLVLVIAASCGCVQQTSDTGTGPAAGITSVTVTTGTTVTASPSGMPVPPTDPVVGTWVSYAYTSWGRVKTVITCRENNTWTRNISNFKNEKTEYAYGIWSKESANTYDLKSSLTGASRIFDYAITTDTLSDKHDPGFVLGYNRTAEGTDPFEPVAMAVVPAGLLGSNNLSFIVENLDTPAKAALFTQTKFIFETHGKCTSYSPGEFLKVGRGDCKDYATFLSSILAERGFDAKVVSFKYYKGGVRNGHVVTLFTDTDGKLKYATTPDVTRFREVNSVDDLLDKECSRLGVNSIANYTVLAAGSVDTCVV